MDHLKLVNVLKSTFTRWFLKEFMLIICVNYFLRKTVLYILSCTDRRCYDGFLTDGATFSSSAVSMSIVDNSWPTEKLSREWLKTFPCTATF